MPKSLPSKYFYNKRGDELFQLIMRSEEYYPTRCELEIFQEKTSELADVITPAGKEFDIIELGAGDATKSVHLLKHLLDNGHDFTYYPVDISDNVIALLEATLTKQLDGLKMNGLNGDYFDMLAKAYNLSTKTKVILFLGGNIGNFTRDQALMFFKKVYSHMSPGDIILTGFDLKKNPETIRKAYNDKEGLTAAFNLNLLSRINRELHADFDTNAFMHYPTYDPIDGTCKSFLISLKNQVVSIPDDNSIEFSANEPIFMETAQKYDLDEIDIIAKNTGFTPVGYISDHRRWFVDAVWRKDSKS